MHIVSQVIFDDDDLKVLDLSRWMGLAAHFPYEDRKKVTHFFNQKGPWSAQDIEDGMSHLVLLLGIAKERFARYNAQIPTLPEKADGLLANPKLAAETICRSMYQATNDVKAAITRLNIALNRIEGC
jgi:hypothetical protein